MNKLAGLQQATFILKCLVTGQNKEDIVFEFGGDAQLVDMWISFLKHNKWIERNRDGEWSVTEKGLIWEKRKDDLPSSGIESRHNQSG
jgi:hypothetical protein